MNRQFEYGVQELNEIDRQCSLVTSLAIETGDSVTIAAAEVLDEAKLELYYSLCLVVKRDPDMVQMYARALQRTEVIRFVVDRQRGAEQPHASAQRHLAELATSSEVDVELLEIFFSLFAPTNETYQGYLARKGTIQETQHISTVSSESVVLPEVVEDPSAENSEEGEEPAALELAKDEVQDKDKIVQQVYIDGEVADLTAIEEYIIKRSMELGRTDLAVGMFIDESDFIALANVCTTRSIKTRGGYAQRFRKTIDDLNEKFQDLFLRTGTKGGGRLHLTDMHEVRLATEATTDHETDEDKVTNSNSLEKEGSTTIYQRPVRPTKLDTAPLPLPKPRAKKEGAEYVHRKPMTPTTKLLPDGYMVDRHMIRFTDIEQSIIELINSAPRKEPYSAQRITTSLKGKGLGVGVGDMEQVLADLSGRMPDGWLIKIRGGNNNPDGWRLGKGIRIVRQHKVKDKS